MFSLILGVLGMGASMSGSQDQLDASNNTMFAQSTMNAQAQVSDATSKRNSNYMIIGALVVMVFVVFIAFKGK